jgi:hypothetical protein
MLILADPDQQHRKNIYSKWILESEKCGQPPQEGFVTFSLSGKCLAAWFYVSCTFLNKILISMNTNTVN